MPSSNKLSGVVMMDNDSLSASSSSDDDVTIGPCSPSTTHNDCPTGQRRHRSRQRSRRRRQSTVAIATAATTTILAGSLLTMMTSPTHAIIEHPNNHQHYRSLEVDGTKTRSYQTNCDPMTQHTLLFTLYTDAHSIHDNYWKFSSAAFGVGIEAGNSATYIDSEAVGAGNLGYSAAITHTVCADRASPTGNDMGNPDAKSSVESCYDFELSDSNGDGLTAPHSGAPGLSGGFTLQIDYGEVVVEHRAQACLMGSDDDEWNECALEHGFGYCGVRVCTVLEGNGNGEVGKATISNLSGSHCSLSQPQCSNVAGAGAGSSPSSIKVNADTDSYADELSYEVRKSKRSSSKAMSDATQGELILAGGNPVYAKGTEKVILGQLGVGVAFADNESYESSMCLNSDDKNGNNEDTCFDFRAYDTYGDGMGCGADGTLSITIETPDTSWKLKQVDKDQAKQQDVNGTKRLACMNKQKLSKWSYCAVRVCADGTVQGLQGNQCDFGMGEDLIDDYYLDEMIDPLQDGVDSASALQDGIASASSNVVNAIKPQNGGGWPEKEEVFMVEFEDFGLNIVPPQEKPEIAEGDPTWAEYYANLQPGFLTDGAFQQPIPNKAEVDVDAPIAAAKPYQDNRPNRPGQKGPRPNAAKLDGAEGGNRPNKQGATQKGPRPNAAKLKPMNEELQQAASQEGVLPLKSFSTNLLEVSFPKPIKFPRPNQLSAAVATYLLETFADNDDVDTPTDFDLECDKSKETVGPELLWVMECDGSAIYSDSSDPPRMKVLNSLVRNAFLGESKEDFLELIYGIDLSPTSSSPGGSSNSKNSSQNKRNKKKQMKRKKMLQRLKAKKKMQAQSAALGTGTTVNININQVVSEKKQTISDKKKAKQDRLDAKKQSQMQPQSQEGELNVMGYVSGSQHMNQMSDALGADGNIYVYIDTKKERTREDTKDGTKGGDDKKRKKRMLRSSLVGR